jgi:uncharacterized protein
MKVAKESQSLQNKKIISQTVQFVQQTLQGAESGHDWWHIQRVWNNAILISKTEQADTFIIELAALLHDIADSKFHDGDEEIGPQRAGEFLKSIGIARAFTYGGFKNRELYNPDIPPALTMSKEEYKKSDAPTINHFYEKLLLLKDKMNTDTGLKIAEERHQFMLTYLKQFYNEWNGEHEQL